MKFWTRNSGLLALRGHVRSVVLAGKRQVMASLSAASPGLTRAKLGLQMSFPTVLVQLKEKVEDEKADDVRVYFSEADFNEWNQAVTVGRVPV